MNHFHVKIGEDFHILWVDIEYLDIKMLGG